MAQNRHPVRLRTWCEIPNGHEDFLGLNEVSGWRYVPSDKTTWCDGAHRKCRHLIFYRVRLKQWIPDRLLNDPDGGYDSPDKTNYGYCQGCKAYFVFDSAVTEHRPRKGNFTGQRSERLSTLTARLFTIVLLVSSGGEKATRKADAFTSPMPGLRRLLPRFERMVPGANDVKLSRSVNGCSVKTSGACPRPNGRH